MTTLNKWLFFVCFTQLKMYGRPWVPNGKVNFFHCLYTQKFFVNIRNKKSFSECFHGNAISKTITFYRYQNMHTYVAIVMTYEFSVYCCISNILILAFEMFLFEAHTMKITVIYILLEQQYIYTYIANQVVTFMYNYVNLISDLQFRYANLVVKIWETPLTSHVKILKVIRNITTHLFIHDVITSVFELLLK